MSQFLTESTRLAEHNLDVLIGNVSGHIMVSIIGHDDDLTTTRTTLAPTLTTSNIDQSGISATPAVVKVASTDAADDKDSTGVRTVRILGLDDSGVDQNEIITLEGQAEQTSVNTYQTISTIRSVTWGSGNTNAGTVWAGTGTFTSGVPATKYCAMQIDFNRSMTAYYCVPTDKTLYFRQLTVQLGSANKDVELFVEQSSNGINWFTEAVFSI